MSKFLNRIRNDKRGVTAMEYGLIAAMAAILIVGAVGTLGTGLSNAFAGAGKALTTQATGAAATSVATPGVPSVGQ